MATSVALLLAGLGVVARAQAPRPAAPAVAQRPWLNPNLSVDERAQKLLDEMTLDEKIGQMWQVLGIGGEPTGDASKMVQDNDLYQLVRGGQIGSVYNETNPEMANAVQRVAVEESRLGVPLVFGRDVIHGFRTVFPIPLGQAASWNPELVERASAVAAVEARSQGIQWTFGPMVDISRDPRWGRIAESLGEDPYLASQLAVAMVHGLQGDDLASPDHIMACVKHFAGYGAAEGGRDYNTTVISPALLHNVYLRPFHAAVEAGVATLMCSFNEINGVPSSGNVHLLRDILRDQWGFQGIVLSDWQSTLEMIEHGFAADSKDAALLAVRAGVNMEMVSRTYHDHLAELVHEGKVSESAIDQLVLEILRVKFRVGLFERPYTDTSRPSPLLSPEHLDLARQLARQSVVMLKNEHGVLPLDAKKVKKLALIGPLADAPGEQLGAWTPDGRASDSRTLLAAMRERAGGVVRGSPDSAQEGGDLRSRRWHGQETGHNIEVLYAPGLADDLDRSTSGFDQAVAAARQADVVILALGERASISGESHSRAILDLPGAQNELVAAVASVGKPTMLVVQAGRPLTIARQIAEADAVLFSPHAGTMAGPALVDLLWGDESPSGKLPVTMPKTVGQIPLYYNHKNTGRPPQPFNPARDGPLVDQINLDRGYNSNYLEVGPYPLYPFGYGLSYATFEYGRVELSTGKLRPGGTLAVRVPVANTGTVAADEIVQLYVRDVVGSLTRPVRELKGFRRVHLTPGERQIVELALSADDLAFYNNQEEFVLEPGKFEVYVGGNSLAPLVGQFELVE